MRLLFIAYFGNTANGNVFGGAEKVFINLANWLAKNTENEVILASVGCDVLPYPLSSEVKYKYYRTELENKITTHYGLFRNSNLAIKEFSPDKVICFSVHPYFYIILQCMIKQIPTYFSVRNDPKLEHGVVTKIMRFFVMHTAKHIVFQTHQAQNYFGKKIINKSIVIHNPVSVNISEFPINTKPDNRIVSVGRLNEQKNYNLLISAFEKIANKYPDVTLEIYGEGSLRNTLQDLINKKHLDDKCFLRGAFPDVLNRIYGARLFVMTSKYEGMPNALMEAMSLGIPVVASNCPCGGPAELIKHGINGYLFENDNENELVQLLDACLNDPVELREISEREREIISTHSENVIFKKWQELIEC